MKISFFNGQVIINGVVTQLAYGANSNGKLNLFYRNTKGNVEFILLSDANYIREDVLRATVRLWVNANKNKFPSLVWDLNEN